ncbi:MAG: hypothetical protein ACE5JU_02540 [Candidatus Binatia bacterium]
MYNADSGIFNTLVDMAHKIISPQTYACNLCAITHSNFGMHKEWKEFVESLGVPLEFLHRDELKAKYHIDKVPLPAVFKKVGDTLELWINSEEINRFRTIADLKELITKRFHEGQGHDP